MYYKRHLEESVRKLAKMFPSIMLTGPRQVGKTTMLKKCMQKNAKYVTLDNRLDLAMAKEQQELFFKQHTPPVIVDEVQYAPNIFSEIKIIVDEKKQKGLFYLTGSQNFSLMNNISESLAGRVGILKLQGLSTREIKKELFNKPFIPTDKYFEARNPKDDETEYWNTWDRIHKGSMPVIYESEMDVEVFYASYVSTYITRDIRDLSQVSDELQFLKFLTVCASMTGNMINYESIANSVGTTANTIKRWISLLVTSGILYILEPYHNNIIKRAIKTPKLYFLDTGLACYLTKWKTAEQIAAGAMSGQFFETHILSEILKSYYNAGITNPSLYYYRDKDKNEIDLIIEENGTLYPIEIKQTGKPDTSMTKAFRHLDKIPNIKRGTGCILCLCDTLRYLDAENFSVPIRYL